MKRKQERVEELKTVLRSEKVATINSLREIMKSSSRSVQRYLREAAALRSYNGNGRYFTLPEIPKFNEYGIWVYKEVSFSKHGSLKDTFAKVVETSEAGLNAIELGRILHIPSYTFLSHFKGDTRIRREKHKGLYIYFSDNVRIRADQIRTRANIIRSRAELALPSDSDAIVILVELVKHPKDDIEHLTARVRRRGIKIPIERVRNLLIYHGIEKKTQDSA